MTTHCRGVLVLAFAGLASCRDPSPAFSLFPVGTRVPISDLTPWRDDLRALVLREIDAGRDASAYFALDLLKTRPYVELRLAGQHATDELRDLRPMVDSLLAADESRRALRIVHHPGPRRSTQSGSDVYWRHVVQFEGRIAALNEKTLGIPYSYAARKTYGVSSAEETEVLLSDDEALLNVLIHGDRAYGLVVVSDKLVVRPLAWPSERLRHVVRRFLDRIREPPSSESMASWTADAAALHDAIIGPFAKELGDRRLRTLLVSPDDFLASLPFSVLLEPTPTGRRALVERLRVDYIPSISVYRQLLDRPILNQAPRVLAVANAIYPAGVPKLPLAEREAVSVSELFPNATLLVGAAAQEKRIVALSPEHNVLHFATHGLLLGDLVPGASSLLVTADDAHDGFLNAAEIAALDLSHTYVAVLSACETAVAEDGGSTDLGSLTNAFLGAGTPTVIGSLWQVEDHATTLIMLGFYRRFLEVGAAEALRLAMLEVRADPRFAHPFYWAAFALYGWGR